MTTSYSDLQLDALREVANIGSGTAATALSTMLGRPVDLTVPAASALPLADAVECLGDPESDVHAVVLFVEGDLRATVLLVFTPESAAELCTMLGVEADSEVGVSCLAEIGNILSSSYLIALGQMTGLALEPTPPQSARDMLGAIVSTVLLSEVGGDVALLLDSNLVVEESSCSFGFVLVPTAEAVRDLLAGLGLQ